MDEADRAATPGTCYDFGCGVTPPNPIADKPGRQFTHAPSDRFRPSQSLAVFAILV
jgi:hypothetical protein